MYQARYLFIFAFTLSFDTMGMENPPDVVYRVDTRPPEEIFVHGFRAWGGDHNIVAHVNGHTCTGLGRTSAFISTMTNYDMVNALAGSHLRERPITYVYSIRADSTFYNAAASVEYYQRYNPASPLSVASLRMAQRVREWVAVSHILPENIHSVQVRRSGEADEIFMNIMYVNATTRANADIYTAFAAETRQHYGFQVAMPDNSTAWFSACFVSCLDTRVSFSSGPLSSLPSNGQCAAPNVIRRDDALSVLVSGAA